MRFLSSSLLAVAVVACSSAAYADSVSFVSSSATTTTGANLTASQTGPAAYQVAKNAAYPTAQPGSFYVSTNANGNQTDVVAYYTDAVTLGSGTVSSATVNFTADDYASIFVNGVLAYSPTSTSQYGIVTTAMLQASLFTAGVNYITFANTNTGGPGAIDFAGTITGTNLAATPEPSSLMLLGTGVLGAAGALRRRFQKA